MLIPNHQAAPALANRVPMPARVPFICPPGMPVHEAAAHVARVGYRLVHDGRRLQMALVPAAGQQPVGEVA